MNEDAEDKNAPIPDENMNEVPAKEELDQLETKNNWTSYATTGWTSYLLITVGLLLLLFLTVYISKVWVDAETKDLTSAFELEDKPLECKIVGSQEKQGFIKKQSSEITKYANNHKRTAIEFYGYFYATFAVFSLFGLLAAISLAVIARKGIDEASSHLITVFFVSTGIVILYQGFFGVFQQKANIDNNAKLFVNYAKLNTQIDIYCTTGKLTVIDPNIVFNDSLPKQPATSSSPNATPTANPTAIPDKTPTQTSSTSKVSTFYISPEPDEFINYIGWQMAQLRAISIAIDDSKIVAIDGSKLIITQP